MTVLDECVLVMAPVSMELMLIRASVTQDLLAWTVKVSISLCLKCWFPLAGSLLYATFCIHKMALSL